MTATYGVWSSSFTDRRKSRTLLPKAAPTPARRLAPKMAMMMAKIISSSTEPKVGIFLPPLKTRAIHYVPARRIDVCTGTGRRQFDKRTNSPFNELEFSADIVCLMIHWRIHYELSLHALAAMFLERGFACTHEAVRAWGRTLRAARYRQTPSQVHVAVWPLLACLRNVHPCRRRLKLLLPPDRPRGQPGRLAAK